MKIWFSIAFNYPILYYIILYLIKFYDIVLWCNIVFYDMILYHDIVFFSLVYYEIILYNKTLYYNLSNDIVLYMYNIAIYNIVTTTQCFINCQT